MLDNITRPAPTVFRLSPLATWAKVLARTPGIDHYSISNAEGTIAGSATLQRFPRAEIEGRAAVPILAHSHVYPLGRGGQYAAFTSRAYWFDAATGALIGECVYSDNRSHLTLSEGMGPWDWQLTGIEALTLPMQPITIDFAQTDIGYTSAWSEVRPAMGYGSAALGQGSAYARGEPYSLPGQTSERRVTVETGNGPGLIGYRWTTRVNQEGLEPRLSDVAFWINTGMNAVQHLDCDMTVVAVNPDSGEHSWVQQRARWTRVG